ncbi:MAG: winged helix-turn-helix transcriptional regulator [Candidatus Heimdallarchaeota archaeon]
MFKYKRLLFWLFFLLFLLGFIVLLVLNFPELGFFEPNYSKIIWYVVLSICIAFFILGSVLAIGSTLTRETVLNNYHRARIFAAIEQNPGIHFNELTKLLVLSNGQTHWHLTCLKNFEMIKTVKAKNYKTFYPNYGMLFENIDSSQLVTLKNKTRNAIFQEICTNPSITQSNLQKILRISQSTIAYHLIILEQENLISIQRKGRKRFYYSVKDQVAE